MAIPRTISRQEFTDTPRCCECYGFSGKRQERYDLAAREARCVIPVVDQGGTLPVALIKATDYESLCKI